MTTAVPMPVLPGAINFYKDIDRIVNTRIWDFIEAPWEKQTSMNASFVKAV